MKLKIIRDDYTEDTCVGKLYADGKYICETLEDCSRGYGIKIAGKTALPVGDYQITITPSNRFKRLMILVYTNPKDLSCELGGIRFTGIRFHGGNTHLDSDGCILVAKNRLAANKIQGTQETQVFDLVKAAMDRGEKVTLTIENKPKSK